MDRQYYIALAMVRLTRAEELITEAKNLLETEAYKSANNRAYYAIEKCVKALWAIKETDATTHSGVLKQFNYHYIFQGDGTFTAEDYKMIAGAERIRSASDYDDFYVASKAETVEQVKNAEHLFQRIKEYILNQT